MITGSFIKSRYGPDGTNTTYHSSSPDTRIGRIFGLAVRAMRLANVNCAAVSLSAVLSMVVSAVAYTLDTALDLVAPKITRSALLVSHVLRCAADAAAYVSCTSPSAVMAPRLVMISARSLLAAQFFSTWRP